MLEAQVTRLNWLVSVGDSSDGAGDYNTFEVVRDNGGQRVVSCLHGVTVVPQDRIGVVFDGVQTLIRGYWAIEAMNKAQGVKV